MQPEQADHEEAQRIIEDSIHWYHENVSSFNALQEIYDRDAFTDAVDSYCTEYCQFIEDKFGIRVKLEETAHPLKRDIFIVDCNKQALTMLKLAMT